MKDPRDIIKRPIITENSTKQMELLVYTFEVAGDANKIEIAQAVEAVFPGAKVVRVNTMWVKPKRKRFGRHYGYTSKWKKAMVKLTEDSQQPEFFASV
ncbi:MAG: 50S ribosomal protein L23 [Bacilli bacterium]